MSTSGILVPSAVDPDAVDEVFEIPRGMTGKSWEALCWMVFYENVPNCDIATKGAIPHPHAWWQGEWEEDDGTIYFVIDPRTAQALYRRGFVIHAPGREYRWKVTKLGRALVRGQALVA